MSTYRETSYANQLENFSSFTIRHSRALALFNQARYAATLGKFKSMLLRSKTELLDLGDIPMKNISSQHYSGIKAVKLDQICGTSGRVSDFDSNLNPLSDHIRDRWMSIAMVRFNNEPLPAVKLIQVGNCYYIRDGHHRISVARTLGEYAIDAEVITWELHEENCKQNQCAAQNAPLAI